MSVAIEIHWKHVDGAGFLYDKMILIGLVGFVFQPSHLALINETIHGDHKIYITVAVKIARFDICHSANLVQQGHGGKSHRAVIGQ